MLPRLTIPANKTTTYLTQYIQLPKDKKRWVLRYAPLFNHPLVHHAVVYACDKRAVAAIANLSKAEGALDPFDEDDDQPLCHQILMLGAPNVRPYELPNNTGIPIGPGYPEWVALEIHYNNPDHLEGQVDPGSGVWFEYTDKPQAQDVGLFTLSQMDLHVPPGLESFSAPTAICPGTCTSRFKQPITLLDQGYHMHGTGKSAKTRRFRDGVELPPLYQQNGFDYGFQSLVPVPQGSNILTPGERLELTCTFDSRDRVNVTDFGPGTNDEMCFHWIYYIPAQADMGLCSTVSNGTLAVCSPDYITPSYALAMQMMKQKGGNEMVAAFEASGELVKVPANETLGAAPYKEACVASP